MSSGKRNFYEILNARPEATHDELKRNYKQLILQCHPDKLSDKSPPLIDADTTAAAAAVAIGPNDNEFVTINEAWNTLKDTAQRKLYNAELLLMKFETQNNIYARLQLSDMERQPSFSDNVDNPTTTTATYTAITPITTDSGDDDGNSRDKMTKSGLPFSKEHDVQEALTELCPRSELGTARGMRGRVQQTKSIIYTYNCRCGGQYIVDESADNEIFSRNDADDDPCDSDEVIVECNECSLVIILLNG